MIVIPDASVLLKWVLPGDDEQDGDAALFLRDEAVAGAVELVVPQLWLYEVGNTLARRFPHQAGELLASLADFGLTEARLDLRWRTQAVSLAVAYEVAFYDAAYHAVALVHGGVFVTEGVPLVVESRRRQEHITLPSAARQGRHPRHRGAPSASTDVHTR